MKTYEYKMRTDVIIGEESEPHIGYGVELWQISGRKAELVKIVRDVFLERSRAVELVKLCNKLKLSPLHLMDVIEDCIS